MPGAQLPGGTPGSHVSSPADVRRQERVRSGWHWVAVVAFPVHLTAPLKGQRCKGVWEVSTSVEARRSRCPPKPDLPTELCQHPAKQTPYPGCGQTQECGIIGNVRGMRRAGWGARQRGAEEEGKKNDFEATPQSTKAHPVSFMLRAQASPGLTAKLRALYHNEEGNHPFRNKQAFVLGPGSCAGLEVL